MPTPQHRLPTYKQAWLQVVAYRSIREVVQECLDQYALNTTDWIILGMLSEQPNKLRVTDIAAEVRVEGAFITSTVHRLAAADFVTYTTHPQDNRARLLSLTTTGKQLVKKIEPELQQHLQALTTGINGAELASYFSTLEAFIRNTNR